MTTREDMTAWRQAQEEMDAAPPAPPPIYEWEIVRDDGRKAWGKYNGHLLKPDGRYLGPYGPGWRKSFALHRWYLTKRGARRALKKLIALDQKTRYVVDGGIVEVSVD